MELTDDQRQTLHDAGIYPDDLERDLAELLTLIKETDNHFSDFTADNAREKFEGFVDKYERVTELSEKYVNPATEEILDAAYKEETGESLDDLELERLEEDLEAINERLEDDPEFAEAVEANLADYGEEFSRRFDELEARNEARDELNETLEEERDARASTITINMIGDGLRKDCNIDECTDQEKELQKLQELSDRTEHLEDENLPPEDKIAIYEEYLETYQRVVNSYSLEGDKETPEDKRFELVKTEVDRLIGIPPEGLVNKGAHYLELLADQVSTLVEKAEHGEDLSDDERYQLYSEAYELLTEDKYSSVFPIDQEYLENISGYTADYLQGRIDFHYDSLTDSEQLQKTTENVQEVVSKMGLLGNSANDEDITPNQGTQAPASGIKFS